MMSIFSQQQLRWAFFSDYLMLSCGVGILALVTIILIIYVKLLKRDYFTEGLLDFFCFAFGIMGSVVGIALLVTSILDILKYYVAPAVWVATHLH